MIDDAQDETNKYDFRFLTDKEFGEMTEGFWYKIGDILFMTQPGETSQYVLDNIAFAGTYTKEQTMHANNTLQKLYNVVHTDKTLSYYKEKASELDKVLNIFIRVNSGGTVLTYSDLLLSIASAQWENHDAREEITDFVDDINSIGGGFRINKDFVLKTALVLTDFPNIAFKVDNFNKSNMMKIEMNWENIKRAIKLSVHLISSFGYTGETLIRDIIRENGNNEFPITEIIDKFKGTNKSIQFTEDDIDEYLLKLRYGKSETLSVLMLLYPSLDFSNKFHEDHMYPRSKFKKSYLRKMGISEDRLDTYINSVNDIGNLQLLAAQLNEEKLDTDFDVWFHKQQVTDTDKIQYRKIHYLPDMDYTYDMFLEFIEKRKKLLKKQLKAELM